jgi:hypothetical protein
MRTMLRIATFTLAVLAAGAAPAWAADQGGNDVLKGTWLSN